MRMIWGAILMSAILTAAYFCGNQSCSSSFRQHVTKGNIMHIQSVLFWLLFAADASPSAKLVWVNPSRCLPVCIGTTNLPLVRVNGSAVPDPSGKFRIETVAVAPTLNLLAAARQAGHRLQLKAAIRSYGDQAFVFGKYKEKGRAARPGHTEHQIGAIDLTLPSDAAIKWLAENAHRHGFTLSYPPGKQRVTGYRYEPWHVRFVGVQLAAELFERKITLEEWFREHPDAGESGDCGNCPLPISRASCGKITPEGECHGSVLAWCYDGALAEVDCGVSGERCGRAPQSSKATCLKR